MTILLLDIPGLHLAYLGCYGNDWVATPNLDALACQAVLFDRHFAGGPGDLRTGRYHLPRSTDTSVPGSAGFDPNWFLANGGLDSFDVVAAGDETAPLDEGFHQVLQGILAALKKKPRPRQQLVWAEFPSLSPPWQLPPDMLDAYFDEAEDPGVTPPAYAGGSPTPAMLPPGDDEFDRLQFTYAAVATFVDAQIGWLLDKLKRGKWLDQLLLMVTSSRALPLGEHGWVGYQRAWQHEENVHLPLLIRLPGGEEGGLRIGALTQPVDVIPSLIDHLALPPATLPGRSLWPLIRQEITEVRPHACSGDRIGAHAELSLRTLEWAYLLPLSNPSEDPPRSPRFYVKPDDRWEVNDVCQQHPDLAEQMDKTLRAFVDSEPTREAR